MAPTKLKNIFLSASIPLPNRDAGYFETADIVAIRDAIIGLASAVLPKYRLIWGGHPSITPIIYYVMQRLGFNVQEHVRLYQSLWFEDEFPEDNNKFKNIVFTEKLHDVESSTHLMRRRMFDENKYSAAVFIGGMKGIEVEYRMFREKYPEALIIPVASTGAATKMVYDNILPDEHKNTRFLRDYGYMSLFQNLLIDKI